MGVVPGVICARDWRSVLGGQRQWGLLNLVLGAAGALGKGWQEREVPWTFTQARWLWGALNSCTSPSTGYIQGLQ